jgi:hypothetical protein
MQLRAGVMVKSPERTRIIRVQTPTVQVAVVATVYLIKVNKKKLLIH